MLFDGVRLCAKLQIVIHGIFFFVQANVMQTISKQVVSLIFSYITRFRRAKPFWRAIETPMGYNADRIKT